NSYESDVSVPTSPVHDSKTVPAVFNIEPTTTKSTKEMSHSNRPSSPIIEDWVSDSEDKSEVTTVKAKQGNLQQALKDKGVIDSGYSRHMAGNISYLSDFEEINGWYVAFGGNPKGGKITGKSKIRTCKLDFDDVYFVKELKFNLFSVSQMCDKKNNGPRENNMYNVDLKNIVPSGDLTCLLAKATLDESNL
nr:hypothetical protein [Tanacetum cinerariifolium]